MVTCCGISKFLTLTTQVELQTSMNQCIAPWTFLSRVLDLDDIKKCKQIKYIFLINTASPHIKYGFEREQRKRQAENRRELVRQSNKTHYSPGVITQQESKYGNGGINLISLQENLIKANYALKKSKPINYSIFFPLHLLFNHRTYRIYHSNSLNRECIKYNLSLLLCMFQHE